MRGSVSPSRSGSFAMRGGFSPNLSLTQCGPIRHSCDLPGRDEFCSRSLQAVAVNRDRVTN